MRWPPLNRQKIDSSFPEVKFRFHVSVLIERAKIELRTSRKNFVDFTEKKKKEKENRSTL